MKSIHFNLFIKKLYNCHGRLVIEKIYKIRSKKYPQYT